MCTDPRRRPFESLNNVAHRWTCWAVPQKSGALLWGATRETFELAYGDLLELVRVELPAVRADGSLLCGVVTSTAQSIYDVEQIWAHDRMAPGFRFDPTRVPR